MSTRMSFDNPTSAALPSTEMEIDISLYEARRGAYRILSIRDPALCPECSNFAIQEQRRCKHCSGKGYIHIYRQVEVKVPAGLLTGEKISFPELGRFNLCTQKNSDLILEIKICPHPYLELVGKNIACTLVIPLVQAIFGKRISVPTLAGKVMIKLCPFHFFSKSYRLKGYGLAGGDQLINIELLPWKKSGKNKDCRQFRGNDRDSDKSKIATLSLPDLNSNVGWV
jgi:DnaJ-class molecular chaperone